MAVRLSGVLEHAGVPCWYAPRDIPPGHNYLDGITSGLARASAVLVLVSPAASASQWVVREVEWATQRGMRIIPVRVGESLPRGPLEILVDTLQWLEVANPSDRTALDAVVAAVREGGGRSLPHIRSTDARLNVAAMSALVGGLLIGAWGIFTLLTNTGTCRFFGTRVACSVGGGYLVVAAFSVVISGMALWTRSRAALALVWLNVLLLVPGAVDGLLHRYKGFAAPAGALGILVPLAIAAIATRYRRRLV